MGPTWLLTREQSKCQGVWIPLTYFSWQAAGDCLQGSYLLRVSGFRGKF